MSGPRATIVTKWLAFAIGLVLLGTVAALNVELIRRPKPMMNKVIIGTKDQVYYSRAATMEDATALGHALESTGFFGDVGTSVLLSRNKGITVVSFVLKDGAWKNADAVASYEEIGRRVASSVGGFPIQVDLADARWTVKKKVWVGKAAIGAKDAVYYLGSATASDAQALGQALREAGYLQDLGASVVISKGEGTIIGFVVAPGVWDRPEAVGSFERLVQRVAGVVGGLPVQLRLLSADMEVKKEAEVR